MGFKRTNYTIKSNGLTLPEAYAFVKNIYINGEKGKAEFVIQASREDAINLEPLETVKITFKVNRNENPYTTAYNHAKSVVTVEREGRVTTHTMPFYGWTDDIHTV